MQVIGYVFVDVKGFSRVPYVATGTNIGDVVISHGGICRNVAENLALLGEPSSFVSMVDDSALGRDVITRLQAVGVDVSRVTACPNGMGYWLALLDETGALVGSVSRQPDPAALTGLIAREADAIAAEDMVLEIDTTAEIAQTLLDAAERSGRKVYCNVSNMAVILAHPEMLSRLSAFICNDIEAGKLFGENLSALSCEAMLSQRERRSAERGIARMIVTMGSRGCVYVDHVSGERGIHPAEKIHVVDSTGAGDAFLSAAVLALSRGRTIGEAAEVGTRAAAATLQSLESTIPKGFRL